MKSSIKFIIIICCLFLLTGCVKYNAKMNINKNKSMNFSIVYAVDKSIFGDVQLLTKNEKKKIKEKGFTIEEYKNKNMTGYKLKIDVHNIDKISTKNNNSYNLTNITKISNDKIFRVKKGIIKNKYKANFKFDSSKNNLTKKNNSKEINGDKKDIQNLEDIEDITSNIEKLDLSFKVSLPYSAISNNATQSSDKDKELVWSLTSDDVSNIEFEFSLYNRITIIIIVAVILIIIILIVSFYKNRKIETVTSNNINKDIEVLDSNNNES